MSKNQGIQLSAVQSARYKLHTFFVSAEDQFHLFIPLKSVSSDS